MIMRKAIALFFFLLLLPGGIVLGQKNESPLEPSLVPETDRLSYASLSFERAKLTVYNGDLTQLTAAFSHLELACLSKEELRLLRNTIFAAHGMIFKADDLRQHFGQFPWYKPVRTNVDGLLTDMDKLNVQSIQAFEIAPQLPEAARSKLMSALVGGWHALNCVPAGHVDRILILADGTVKYYFNEMAPFKRIWKMEGKWRPENGYLIMEISTKYVFLGGYYRGPNYIDFGEIMGDCTGVLQLSKPQVFRLPVHELVNDTERGLPKIRLGSQDFWRMWEVQDFRE